MLARKIRIALANDALVAPVDLATGKPPELWSGSPVRLLLAFMAGASLVLPPALTGVQVQLKAASAGSAPTDDAPVLALATCDQLIPDVSAENWAAGSVAHAALDIAGEALALTPGAYWLIVIGYDAAGNPATLAAGKLMLKGDGYTAGTPAPPPVISAADTIAAKKVQAVSDAASVAALKDKAQSAATAAEAARIAAESAISTSLLEYANLAAFPVSGATGKIYHALDTGLKYIWRSGAYELFVRKASVADAIAGADDSKAVTPAGVRAALTTVRNDFRRFSRAGFSVSVSGAGATAATGDIGASWMGPNAGVAGYVYGRPFGISQINQTAQLLRIGVAANSGYDFAKRIVLTGTSLFSGISTGVTCWVTLGKGEGVRGNPTTRSIGWRRVGAGVLELVVHNGADLVAVATTVSPSGAFHWQLVNHGTGVVEFYVNDVLVASSAAGPTGPSNAITATYAEEIDCTGAQSWRPELWCSGGGLFHAI